MLIVIFFVAVFVLFLFWAQNENRPMFWSFMIVGLMFFVMEWLNLYPAYPAVQTDGSEVAVMYLQPPLIYSGIPFLFFFAGGATYLRHRVGVTQFGRGVQGLFWGMLFGYIWQIHLAYAPPIRLDGTGFNAETVEQVLAEQQRWYDMSVAILLYACLAVCLLAAFSLPPNLKLLFKRS